MAKCNCNYMISCQKKRQCLYKTQWMSFVKPLLKGKNIKEIKMTNEYIKQNKK